MYQKSKVRSGLLTSLIISIILILLTAVFVSNRQQIIDQINVWTYRPSSEISDLVVKSGMNDYGKFIFYASQPKLDGTSEFNTECDRVETTTAILGCYNGYKIYIYNVTDPKVSGVREVTAAHEMLHAAYIRISSSEKAEVNKLLEEEYKKLSKNKDFSELIAFYSRTEPGQRDNELHSIIGTEVSNVGSKLEDYYKKYFSSRQKVVTLNAKYQNVFHANKARADALLKQYNQLGAKISSEISKYNSDVQTLNNDIASFNARAASGSFSSTLQFNTERSALLARISDVEYQRQVINNDTKTYQQIYNEYNQIATESKKLFSLLDSSLAPAPSL